MDKTSLTRRRFLQLVGASSATFAMRGSLTAAVADAITPTATAGKRKPNILVILADDLGYGETGPQGNKQIPTPNIDSIARGGVRFTNGYVSCPVCSPTRAGLLTGRYQERFGHEFNPGPAAPENFGLPLSETTIASRLKAAGYKTGIVGKWHQGHDEKHVPLARGFDEFFGFLGGAHKYFIDGKEKGNNAVMRGNETVAEKEYLTDAFAREATSFVNRHKDEPFFLYLAFNAVHAPLQAPQKYMDRFPDIKDKKRQTFAAMLSAMDDAIGSVLGAVRTNNLEEDTLIFFLSDNGGPTLSTTSGNGPLRGYKGQVFEGGIRVPYMVQWKGHLPAGVVSDKPVISLDIAPTAMAAAGASPADAKFDGVNLIPSLTGDAKPHDTLFWRFGEQSAIRDGNWKLTKTAEGTQLYDLSTDVGEKTDLASQKPEKLKELSDKWAKWDSELAKPLWPQRGRKGKAKAGKKKKAST